MEQVSGSKTFLLGILTPSTHELDNILNHTIPELAKSGYVEGKNLKIESRLGKLEDLANMAEALVALQPDAIITVGPPATHAVQSATTDIPIIMGFMGQDPVAAGLAKSLAQPGGNVTGTLILGQDLEGKRLQLLHETLPERKRIAVLLEPGNKLVKAAMEEDLLGLDLVVFTADNPKSYPNVFTRMRTEGIQALLIAPSPAFFRDTEILVKLALENGIPTMCQWPEMAEAGCLLGYGPNYRELRRQTADYLVRIFKGESPGSLPIQQPSQIEFAVNLKTAQTLGISVPISILMRTDLVIE
ncbi:MAG: ABC transporter substrate-binding protein [Gammaproteobacteria bacterium]|nr:ABC transporter substrate-binding protein [Gammaproteobacteria bacterium]